jgi:uncharacterized protein (DUF302 family)
MRRSIASLFATLCLVSAGVAAQPVVSYSKAGAKFSDIHDNLKTAIEAKGFVVDYESHISQMLERTGKDLGAAGQPLYTDARALQFCSAQLSRKMMEADRANAVMCPYTLVVYATAAKPDQVVVAYRRPVRPSGGPASQAALKEVQALLDGLAREAVGLKP